MSCLASSRDTMRSIISPEPLTSLWCVHARGPPSQGPRSRTSHSFLEHEPDAACARVEHLANDALLAVVLLLALRHHRPSSGRQRRCWRSTCRGWGRVQVGLGLGLGRNRGWRREKSSGRHRDWRQGPPSVLVLSRLLALLCFLGRLRLLVPLLPPLAPLPLLPLLPLRRRPRRTRRRQPRRTRRRQPRRRA